MEEEFLIARDDFDEYCKGLILAHKPEATEENALQKYDSISEVMYDYVSKDNSCPSFIKEDYTKANSAKEKDDDEDKAEDEDEENEDGDTLDNEFQDLHEAPDGELYLVVTKTKKICTIYLFFTINFSSADTNYDRELNLEQILIHGQGLMAPDDKKSKLGGGGEAFESTNDDDKKDILESYNIPTYLELFKSFNWNSSYEALEMDSEKMRSYKTFFNGDHGDRQGVIHTYKIPEADDNNQLHPSMLNEKQELVYRYIVNWCQNGSMNQILMHIQGK